MTYDHLLNKKTNNQTKSTFELLKGLFERTGAKPVLFLIPALISLAAASLEGLSIGLLAPLAQGVLERSFEFVIKIKIVGPAFIEFTNLFPRPYMAAFICFILIIFCIAVLSQCCVYLSNLSVSRLVLDWTHRLRHALFDRYMTFGKLFFDRANFGHLSNIVLVFSVEIGQTMVQMHRIMTAGMMLSAYLMILLFISWKFTLVCIPAFLGLYYFAGWIIHKIRHGSMALAGYENDINHKIMNILLGLPLVKAYSREEEESRHFKRLSEQLNRVRFSIEKKQLTVGPLQEIIVLSSILIVAGVASFGFVQGQQAEISKLLVYFLALRRAMNSFGTLNHMRAIFAGIHGQLEQVEQLFGEEEKVYVAGGERKFEGLKHEIKFNNLQFGYRQDSPVFNGLSMTLKKGQITAIVGETGAGKSTLAHLLLRFYDCGPGMITVDGVDIREFDVKSLREKMAFVGQDAILFNDSIRNNLVYGLNRKISNEELVEVTKKARLYNYIQGLPCGFDEVVGDRGVRLSGGEKQRLSIARAVLKKAEILIFDEATSSLDSITERLIQEAVEEAIKGKTAVIIAHRLSTIKNSNRILVLEKGELIESGSLDELLGHQQKFYQYWQEQRFH